MKAISRTLAVAVLSTLISTLAWAADPVGWRMDGNGQYPQADPPLEWSTEKNVIWKTPLPAWGNASPILVGDRVFITSEPATLICLDRQSGRILWQKANTYADFMNPEDLAKFEQADKQVELLSRQIQPLQKQRGNLAKEIKKNPDDAELKEQAKQIEEQIKPLEAERNKAARDTLPATHDSNGYSSSTPASDGASVCAVFGTGVVCCYDPRGNRKWIKLLEKPTDGYGHGASPVIADGKLIVQILDVVALDLADGKEIWRVKGKPHRGSLTRTRIADKDFVITPNGEIIRAADGDVLARGVSSLEYSTPITHDGIVYFIEHKGKAVRLPVATDSRPKSDVLWQTTPKEERYYASPALCDGLIYAITRFQTLSVIDAQTGAVVYEKKTLDLGAEAYSSITLAGKYLYISGENGVTAVLKPGREYKEVARNKLEEFRTTPVFSGTRMYIRGKKHMYCIGPVPATASAPTTAP